MACKFSITESHRKLLHLLLNNNFSKSDEKKIWAKGWDTLLTHEQNGHDLNKIGDLEIVLNAMEGLSFEQKEKLLESYRNEDSPELLKSVLRFLHSLAPPETIEALFKAPETPDFEPETANPLSCPKTDSDLIFEAYAKASNSYCFKHMPKDLVLSRKTTVADDFEPKKRTKIEKIQALPLFSEAGNQIFAGFLQENSGYSLKEIKWKDFMRSLNLLLIGIESPLFTFDSKLKNFTVEESSFVSGISPRAFSESLSPCLEAGTCFSSISQLVSKISICTPTLRALNCQIEAKCLEYRKSVADICNSEQNNFHQLMTELEKPCQVIKIVHLYADAQFSISNDEKDTMHLLSHSFACVSNSAPNSIFHSISRDFLDAQLGIYLSLLKKWTVFGTLNPAFSESFLVENVDSRFFAGRKYWKEAFSLLEDKIPTFLTRDQCKQILLLGKTNHLLNLTQGEAEAAESEPETETSQLLDYESDLNLHISKALCLENLPHYSKLLVSHLLDSCGLRTHFTQLYNLLLGKSGLFLHSIGQDLFPHLVRNKQPQLIFVSALLTPIFQDALILAQHPGAPIEFLISKMPPKLDTKSPSVLDCVKIVYSAKWPCNIVLTDAVLAEYANIFGFMLSMHWVQWCVHQIKELLDEHRVDLKQMDNDVHRFYLCRREMSHFVGIFMNYLAHEVIEMGWREFEETLDSCQSLDELHAFHKSYLSASINKCLLTSKASKIRTLLLSGVCSQILIFHHTLKHQLPFGDLSKLHKIHARFRSQSKFLYSVLNQWVQKSHEPYLEDLLLRLNMNGFYEYQ